MRNRCTPVLLALLTGLTTAVPAAHADQGAPALAAESAAQERRAPDAVIRLSATASQDQAPERVTLHCGPAGGSHPAAKDACEALKRAGGDFSALGDASEQTVCTLEHAPVRVRATGAWHGSPVDYSKSFSNACVARAQSEGVFDFRTP